MAKYIILIVSLLFTSNSFGQLEKKYDCTSKSNLSLKKRLAFYPFSVAKTIMLVSFSDSESGLPFKNNSVDISKLKEAKKLSYNQIDSLTHLLYNIGVKGNTFTYTPAACYFPRNAILFLDSAEKVIEFIEICFECHRTIQSSKRINSGFSCNQKFDIIKSYFARQGIEFGTSIE